MSEYFKYPRYGECQHCRNEGIQKKCYACRFNENDPVDNWEPEKENRK